MTVNTLNSKNKDLSPRSERHRWKRNIRKACRRKALEHRHYNFKKLGLTNSLLDDFLDIIIIFRDSLEKFDFDSWFKNVKSEKKRGNFFKNLSFGAIKSIGASCYKHNFLDNNFVCKQGNMKEIMSVRPKKIKSQNLPFIIIDKSRGKKNSRKRNRRKNKTNRGMEKKNVHANTWIDEVMNTSKKSLKFLTEKPWYPTWRHNYHKRFKSPFSPNYKSYCHRNFSCGWNLTCVENLFCLEYHYLRIDPPNVVFPNDYFSIRRLSKNFKFINIVNFSEFETGKINVFINNKGLIRDALNDQDWSNNFFQTRENFTVHDFFMTNLVMEKKIRKYIGVSYFDQNKRRCQKEMWQIARDYFGDQVLLDKKKENRYISFKKFLSQVDYEEIKPIDKMLINLNVLPNLVFKKPEKEEMPVKPEKTFIKKTKNVLTRIEKKSKVIEFFDFKDKRTYDKSLSKKQIKAAQKLPPILNYRTHVLNNLDIIFHINNKVINMKPNVSFVERLNIPEVDPKQKDRRKAFYDPDDPEFKKFKDFDGDKFNCNGDEYKIVRNMGGDDIICISFSNFSTFLDSEEIVEYFEESKDNHEIEVYKQESKFVWERFFKKIEEIVEENEKVSDCWDCKSFDLKTDKNDDEEIYDIPVFGQRRKIVVKNLQLKRVKKRRKKGKMEKIFVDDSSLGPVILSKNDREEKSERSDILHLISFLNRKIYETYNIKTNCSLAVFEVLSEQKASSLCGKNKNYRDTIYSCLQRMGLLKDNFFQHVKKPTYASLGSNISYELQNEIWTKERTQIKELNMSQGKEKFECLHNFRFKYLKDHLTIESINDVSFETFNDVNLRSSEK